jgi:murein DD-endopeptidase MepM/ murein hydrolase activator NlpD
MMMLDCSKQKIKYWFIRFSLVAASVVLSPVYAEEKGLSLSEILNLKGDWIQGGLIFGQAPLGTQLKFLGHVVPQTKNGEFVLGLGRDADKSVALSVIFPDGKEVEKKFAVEQRQYRIQRVEGVPSRTVNPDPEHLKRIREEASQARAARKPVTERTDFLAAFQWPLLGPISGIYGSQRYYNGQPRRPHFGVDVAAPSGTPVKAPVAGKVTLAHPDMFFSGGTLIVDHGHGVSSTFLHLSKLLVSVGDEVEQGEVIAEVGATGRVTGAHLDWRMNWFDQRVDPQRLVPPMEQVRGDKLQ